MKEILNYQDIPIPEGLEQRLSALVDRLEAEADPPQTLPVREGANTFEDERSLSSTHSAPSLTGRAWGWSVGSWLWGGAIAAAIVAVAFLVIVPQVRERRELARYEGSYTVVDGQRIDDLGRIKADISEALAVAQVAEANVPASDFASETERTILQAIDDPEMQAVVKRILKE